MISETDDDTWNCVKAVTKKTCIFCCEATYSTIPLGGTTANNTNRNLTKPRILTTSRWSTKSSECVKFISNLVSPTNKNKRREKGKGEGQGI